MSKKAIKPVGSPKTRRWVQRITKRVLNHSKGYTPPEAAKLLGLSVEDVANLRNVTNVSVPMVIKMITEGRYDPHSIIYGKELKKLAPRRSTRLVQRRLVDSRVRTLAKSKSGRVWARLTGLSEIGAYGLRYRKGAHVTLYTVLGFIDAGISLDEIFFGAKATASGKAK